MPKFYVTAEEMQREVVSIVKEDARHIALALRMAVGERIVLSDNEGRDAVCRLESISPELVTARVEERRPSESEFPFPLYLYMGYPKGDKLETVIQKATELGAYAVTPFLSSRCIKRPAEEKSERLLGRHNRIAREAAAQSGRSRIPAVKPPLSLEAALREALALGDVLFCYEGEADCSLFRVLESVKAPRALSVFVGSEGGFSPQEAALASSLGAKTVTLGPRILRCETAPLFALSSIIYHFELSKL